MKKRHLKLFLIAGFGAVILAIVAALHRPQRPPERFQFLGDVQSTPKPLLAGIVADLYELDREFNDVCVEAAAELTNLGFVESAPPRPWHGTGSEPRYFLFDDHHSYVFVQICEANDGVLVMISGYRSKFSFGRWLRHVLRRDTTAPSPPARPFVPQGRE
jgi:hypothetical protein